MIPFEAGKYAPDAPPPPETRATSEAMGGFITRLMARPVLEAVQKLKPIAAEAGVSARLEDLPGEARAALAKAAGPLRLLAGLS
jgi:hypothetical protein